MGNLVALFDSHFIYALGWTLVHSIWQGLLVVLLLNVGLKLTYSINPAVRYLLCISALSCCLLLSGLTFYENYTQSLLASQDLSRIQSNISLFYDGSFWSVLYKKINPWLSWVVFVWFVGFSVQFVRYVIDIKQGVQLKTRFTSPLPAEWDERLNSLLALVQIQKKVKFKYSSKISVPCIVGHFKPVVLLPLGLFSQLPTDQIEAIVLHELAHIKRNDFLINLVQYLVKIVFFFNPFILAVCRNIEIERESACDDIAVNACGDPMVFALSLSRFAEFSQKQQTVLAASQDKFLLLGRVKRLFKHSIPVSAAIERLILLIGIAVFGLTLNVNAKDKGAGVSETVETAKMVTELSVENAEQSKIDNTFSDSVPRESNFPSYERQALSSMESTEEVNNFQRKRVTESPLLAQNNYAEIPNEVIVANTLEASSARDFELKYKPLTTIDDEYAGVGDQTDEEQTTDSTYGGEKSYNEEEPLIKFDKPLSESPLVQINNSGFDLVLFESKIADSSYKGIKVLPINVDKTVVDAKFQRWEPITYQGLKDSLNGINLLVKQHNAQLGGIPDQDLLVAKIDIQKVVHIKLYSGMLGHIRTKYSPSVNYLVGTQIQLLVSDKGGDKMGIIWSRFNLDNESPSGRNLRSWNTETQQNYWQEVINLTLEDLDKTFRQIETHNYVQFKPEPKAEKQDLWQDQWFY